MRRSAAPSLNSTVKKQKFNTPFKSNESLASKFGLATGPTNTSDKENDVNFFREDTHSKASCSNDQNKGRADTTKQSSHCETTSLAELHTSKNCISRTSLARSDDEKQIFSVVWCKASTKKHKKWEGDGVITTQGKCVTLHDMEGRQIAKTSNYKLSELDNLVDGSTLLICSKEIEILGKIDKEDYLSGKCFSETASFVPAELTTEPIKPFISHCKGPTTKSTLSEKTPRHDPNKEGALVTKRPSSTASKGNCVIVDVVVDPFISSYLRPHQRDGVNFLYECVMGMQTDTGCGAILADEMGLGKTLQCIALLWTLLKQGPYGHPVVKKVIIVTPGSLVKNWCKEITKWLGSERLIPFAVDGKKRVDEFLLHQKAPVLIISYEMFLRCISDIEKVKFGMIICDEAHRLKNASVKTSTAISSLAIARRILLTGTPIQNNLEEFYALSEMANPGLLGSLNSFKKIFIEPITRSQQANCPLEEKIIGAKRAEELTNMISKFCLRRTTEIIQAYLPPKYEYVVFIKMSNLQEKLYRQLLKSTLVRSCLTYVQDGSRHLICISALKKVCNHPTLIYDLLQDQQFTEQEPLYGNLLPLFPEDYSGNKPAECSAKLRVVASLLKSFRKKNEKCVLVSNSTKTLDILEGYLCDWNYTCVRLDGQTQIQNRQEIVDRFNQKGSNVDVFLLSSKAGGVGLNLIGACHLILYDIDWNPANDLQAMARVWRDGQKKIVHIYRLILTSSIEEKIYQRQIMKQTLSDTVVDSLINDKIGFSADELKDLFRFKCSETCLTHDMLRCNCLRENGVPSLEAKTSFDLVGGKNVSMAELMKWEHIKDLSIEPNLNVGLKNCSIISFLFRNNSSSSNS